MRCLVHFLLIGRQSLIIPCDCNYFIIERKISEKIIFDVKLIMHLKTGAIRHRFFLKKISMRKKNLLSLKGGPRAL